MSDQTPVTVLLAKLSRCSPTISAAYFDTRLHLSDENAKDVAMLRQFRLLSPDVRDAFRLRGSFRQFLNTALSTERLYAIGANIGGYFERLSKLIEEHSYAFHEGRDVDCERYETDIRREYRWVPGPLYRRARRALLQGFLERPRLYATDALHSQREARARANLTAALARLRNAASGA